MNTITFGKDQKQLIGEFVKFIDKGNALNDDHQFDIQMLIRNEEELTIIDFADKFECDGFVYVDDDHYVETNKGVDHYIDIDPDCTYVIDTGGLTVRRVKGRELLNNI